MDTKDEGRNMKDEGELIHKYWIEQNGLWEQRLKDVRENGFDNASPIARLVYACQIGQIDQHTSEDLKAISAFIQASYETIENLRSELARLRRIEDALRKIASRGVVFDAKGTWSQEVNRIANDALNESEPK